MSFGNELIQSANEALEIARGDVEPASDYVPETVDVAAIRKQQGLTRSAFAERYGLAESAIRDWEQHRRSPDRAAVLLLKVIERHPDIVAQAVRA
ncbi:DNA-binding transcriptional regulator [Phaeobacter sp. HF9A]|uniref:helix-turn-helix domain-containing protein n=1 Tax=Phaeobacter sp. HF9A TaxID=2721561 RepID=UPI0014321A9A|nr:type II toxin-antitoxin system MqsA family antitoxin [Phaeobacter sp. HF9A]NIZ14079.1 type II toxin-antitoxin system MqsA family antitoxin [Phaeobacter sp. HF9A]